MSFLSLGVNFMSEEQRTSGLCSTMYSVLCGSHNKRMCVREKRAHKKRRKEREREKERDLKPTSTSYSSEGATTEIDIWKSRSTIPPRTSNSKERVVDGRKGKGAKKEEESWLKEQRSRRRTGSTAARRNSSLVKGAIIQGIAPGPQTAHKLWAFNFAILTGRSDECRGERDS